MKPKYLQILSTEELINNLFDGTRQQVCCTALQVRDCPIGPPSATTSHNRTSSSLICCFTTMPTSLRPKFSVWLKTISSSAEFYRQSFLRISFSLHLQIITSKQYPVVAPSKMARKKSNKQKKETKVSIMFPSLHQDVVDAISDSIISPRFHEHDSDRNSNQRYSTHVMGKFQCKNSACSKGGWASKKVAILIRAYPRNGYNAAVFNQRCQACNQLGTLALDEESYVDRVAYRLKKWADIPVDKPPHSRKKGLPHKSDLCEGCKRGVCRESNDEEHY